MFKRIIINNIKPFFISTSVVGSSILCYFSYVAYSNRTNFEKINLDNDLYKDTTRDSNDYYGLNWGYRAD